MNDGANLTKGGSADSSVKTCISAISLKLQLSLLCQCLTLLYEVLLPEKSMDSILKYKLWQQLPLLPKSSV